MAYIDLDIAVKTAIDVCNELFQKNGQHLTSIEAVDIADALDNLPKADVAEVKHGEWIPYSTTMMECTVCKRHTPKHRYEFCPHCGARMDGEE